ncbi:uncharacterized protein LOC134350223 isoform X2 [Mobula hypostoma]|uniref:uncharacterized protein LOC134350223 isoform X2 n=1 Tax=Mobula hypostoma TaxID=723540 RepID=UPI002FC29535
MKFKSSRVGMQPVPSLLHPLLLAAVLSRVTEGQRVCREESFGDDAHDVALNCSDPSYAQPVLVQWRWSKLSGPTKEVLLVQLLNGNFTKYAGRPGLSFSTQSCVNSGDCTLTLKPRKEDTGFYHCVVWTNVRITETKIRLIYKGDFKTAYIVAGACGGVLMIAVVILLLYLRRRARNPARSFDLQIFNPQASFRILRDSITFSSVSGCKMHQQSRENREPLYTNLNQAERDLYCNLKL